MHTLAQIAPRYVISHGSDGSILFGGRVWVLSLCALFVLFCIGAAFAGGYYLHEIQRRRAMLHADPNNHRALKCGRQ